MTNPMLQGLRDQLVNGAVQHRRRRRQFTVTAVVLFVAQIGMGSYVLAVGDSAQRTIASRRTPRSLHSQLLSRVVPCDASLPEH